MIKYFIINLLLIFMSTASLGQKSPLKDYQWKNRIVVINEGQQNDKLIEQQITNYSNAVMKYQDRDLKVLVIKDENVEELENNTSKLLKINKKQLINFLSINDAEQFKVFLIGKDGGIKLKSDQVMTNEKLFSTIDAMPMRRNEMRDN